MKGKFWFFFLQFNNLVKLIEFLILIYKYLPMMMMIMITLKSFYFSYIKLKGVYDKICLT